MEEAGRPVPKLIRLGSLRDIAEELGMGGNTNEVKRAFRQNAGAFVTMKVSYKTLEGKRKTLEADFTRYNVIFTGELLPDERKAECVYINLNDIYRSVLNEVPWRPQDYDYLKRLTPAAQRFYEIISARFYGMFRRGDSDGVRISYSEYCAYSAQQRYFDYEHVKKQMYKVHQPHKESCYLASVKFENTQDENGRADWMMTYTPGAKAYNEHDYFTGKNPVLETKFLSEAKSESVAVDADLLGELTKRGIDEKQARTLLANAAADQDVLEQLEYADWRVATAPAETFHNPPGFYISVLKDNAAVPDTFESSRKLRDREELARKRDAELLRQAQIEIAYEDYKRKTVERYIEQSVSVNEHEALIAELQRSYVLQFKNASQWPSETLRSVAMNAAVVEIAKRVPLISLEEFASTCPAAEPSATVAGRPQAMSFSF
jgi:hypothetical protein